MSELREAAKEALRWMEHARLHLTIKERMHPDGLSLYDSAAEALRAALAQPETEPVAWLVMGRGEIQRIMGNEPAADQLAAALRRSGADRVAIHPLYPHPPRDEWRLASEPPDSTRSVLIWLKFGDVETFGKTLGGPSGFAFQNGAITHWRDVTSPTEVA